MAILTMAASAALLLAAPLRAGEPAAEADRASVPAAVVPGNDVRCVYDSMAPEDHEIALLLFAREIMSGGKFRSISRNMRVVDRLIDEARARCAGPFRWSQPRAMAARDYAMSALMSDAIGQSLQMSEHAIAPIERYFQVHRSEFAGLDEITAGQRKSFEAFLVAEGWDKDGGKRFALAAIYLESLMTRARHETAFAAAAKPATTVSRRPSRVKTARRGRP